MNDQPRGDDPCEGALPKRPPDRIWKSNGTGRPCQLCGKQITRLEIQLELEFRREGAQGGDVLHYAHRTCFDARTSDPENPNHAR